MINPRIDDISTISVDGRPLLLVRDLTLEELISVINKANMYNDMIDKLDELNTSLDTGKEIPFQ